MKECNKKVLELVKGVTRNQVERINSKFPPYCAGFLHQPKRPTKK